jgi:hypothetical protein
MPIIEDAKKLAERMTGIGRPGELSNLVRERKPATFRFKDDGTVPNHPRWPLIHYRGPVALPNGVDPAAVFERLFERNGWADSWRNGVYNYLHYHNCASRQATWWCCPRAPATSVCPPARTS